MGGWVDVLHCCKRERRRGMDCGAGAARRTTFHGPAATVPHRAAAQLTDVVLRSIQKRALTWVAS